MFKYGLQNVLPLVEFGQPAGRKEGWMYGLLNEWRYLSKYSHSDARFNVCRYFKNCDDLLRAA